MIKISKFIRAFALTWVVASLAAWVAPSTGSADAGQGTGSGSLVILKTAAATGIDARYQPIGALKNFPHGTNKVYCWLQWKGAASGDRIQARWIYVSKKMTIYEFPIPLPIEAGSGGVALAMPGNQPFPKGKYRVDLVGSDQKVLKTLNFKIL